MKHRKNRVLIEAASPDDLGEIIKIHLSHFKKIGETQKSAKDLFSGGGDKIKLFVAKDVESKVIGYLQIYLGERAYLTWMGVSPGSEGCGAGSALLQYAIKYSRKHGAKEIKLDSRNRFKRAMGLYLKNDFDIIGTWLHKDGELMVNFRQLS